MFAAIFLPAFSLQALLRLRPQMQGEPVAILEGEGRRATILHANAEAGGITAGMTAAQALAECPALQLLTPSLAGEREAGAMLLNAAWTLSPRVEAAGPGLCLADLSGADPGRLAGQTAALRAGLRLLGLTAHVAVAATPLLARYAVHFAHPEKWIRDAKSFLGSVPISFLDLTADETRFFGDLGVRTLGALTAFPRAAVSSRLGQRGDELWGRAAGEWAQPLLAAPFPCRHLAEAELEEPVERLEPLLFLLRRFCDRLAVEVGQFGSGTSKLALTLKLDDEKTYARDFDLPEVTARSDLLFAVLENHLSALQTDTPIVGLALEAFPARRSEQQAGLFDTGLKDAPLFYATLGRLAAVVGSDNVGTPHRLDTHRADAAALTTPASAVPERNSPARPPVSGPCLRRLRPPMPATVELTEARPSFLVCPLASGDVSILRSPFWSSGDWWSPQPWTREEWDVQIGSGLYRLLHVPDGWFIEGIYD